MHEATGEGAGHSSVLDAADVAARAAVKRLLLVHLPPDHAIPAHTLAEARRRFPRMEPGREGGVYELG